MYFGLTDAERAAAAAQGLSKPRGLGYGINLAFALFIMQGEDEDGSTFIHFFNTYTEVASLVSDNLPARLSLFNQEFVEDDQSLFAK